jgi:GNAT superfamily N-acetyltransferase
MFITGPALDDRPGCEAVLRSLPAWFGIEPALQHHVADSASLPGFALREHDGGAPIGFLSLRQHFPQAWEVHCMAIHASHRGHGGGSSLLAHAEHWLVQQGARWLQVKTVAASSASVGYAQTRAFYAARGFQPLEVFPTLWDPHNPALQLLKVLPTA